MSLIESYTAERRARLIRLGKIPAEAKPAAKPAAKPVRRTGIDPAPFYPQMWMWNLVSTSGGEPPRSHPPIGKITDIVCHYFLIQREELLSVRMISELVYPRQICYYLTRKHTAASSMRVGQYFCRDHATVLHGEKKIRRLVKEDWTVAYDIAHLEAML